MADVVPIKKHREYYRQTKRSAAGCLREARSRNPSDVVVIGYDQSGELFIMSEPVDPGHVLWMMESAKAHLLRSGNG